MVRVGLIVALGASQPYIDGLTAAGLGTFGRVGGHLWRSFFNVLQGQVRGGGIVPGCEVDVAERGREGVFIRMARRALGTELGAQVTTFVAKMRSQAAAGNQIKIYSDVETS